MVTKPKNRVFSALILACRNFSQDFIDLIQLKTLGCDGAQGYLFSRPLGADDFLAWALAAHAANPPLGAVAAAPADPAEVVQIAG